MTNPENKVEALKTKIFLQYRKFSYQHLAKLIQSRTGVKTTRSLVHSVFTGRMTSQRIREALAELVGEPVENFWPKDRRSKKRSKRKNGTASRQSASILNPNADR